MQILTGTVDSYTDQEYRGVSFMLEEERTELLYRVASGDVEAKLQLVKEYLDLVVELAAGYASETGRPFSQMVKAGTLAVIKAANSFDYPQGIGFADHMRLQVIRAIERAGAMLQE
jgi:DNA-directed RNA polymerase sigma subunit (sigma70/sigma32)